MSDAWCRTLGLQTRSTRMKFNKKIYSVVSDEITLFSAWAVLQEIIRDAHVHVFRPFSRFVFCFVTSYGARLVNGDSVQLGFVMRHFEIQENIVLLHFIKWILHLRVAATRNCRVFAFFVRKSSTRIALLLSVIHMRIYR